MSFSRAESGGSLLERSCSKYAAKGAFPLQRHWLRFIAGATMVLVLACVALKGGLSNSASSPGVRASLVSDQGTAPWDRPSAWRAWVPNLEEQASWLPPEGISRGVSYTGSLARVEALAAKLLRRERVHVVAVGGSTTAGKGAYRGGVYHARFVSWLRHVFERTAGKRLAALARPGGASAAAESGEEREWGEIESLDLDIDDRRRKQSLSAGEEEEAILAAPVSRISSSSNGISATPSALFNACMRHIVDPTGDLYLLEFAANDPHVEPVEGPTRRAFEQLLRKILELPRRPAVVLVMQYSRRIAGRTYYRTSEDVLALFGHYYDVPVVSMRDAVWAQMQEQRRGYWTNATLAEQFRDMAWAEASQRVLSGQGVLREPVRPLEADYLYADYTHPADLTGHRAMSDLLVELARRAVRSVAPGRPDGKVRGAAEAAKRIPPLLPPMLEGNEAPERETCLTLDELRGAVLESDGFVWQARDPNATTAVQQQWGMASEDVGASISLVFDSRAGQAQERGAEEKKGKAQERGAEEKEEKKEKKEEKKEKAEEKKAEEKKEKAEEKKAEEGTGRSRRLLQEGSAEAISSPNLGSAPTPSSDGGAEAAAAPAPGGRRLVDVSLAVVRSWHEYGEALMECVEGCRCRPSVLDAAWENPSTQSYISTFQITEHERCVIRLTVQPSRYDPPRTKFEVKALLVSPPGAVLSTGINAKGHGLR